MAAIIFCYTNRKLAHINLVLAPRERLTQQQKLIRAKTRHDAFAAHRQIAMTPMKDLENDAAVANKNKNNDNLNRILAFQQRYADYIKKKNETKKKSSTIRPFVSAVPSGRVVMNNPQPTKKTAIVQPNLKRPLPVIEPVRVVKPHPPTLVKLANNFKKSSPINTRSKKLKLYSPSLLPTPKRKRSTANAAPQKKPVFAVNAKVKATAAKSNFVQPMKVAKVTAMKNTVANKIPAKPKVATGAIPKTTVKNKQPVKKVTATVTSTVTSGQLNEPSLKGFDFSNASQVPSKFQFNDVLTSTVARPNKKSTSSTHSSESSKKLFDESISPIDIGTPKGMPILEMSPTTSANPTSVAGVNGDNLNMTPVNSRQPLDDSVNYVSPFVTITRGRNFSSRKEKLAREKKYSLNARKSIDLNSSTEERQNKEAARYFRQQMKRETDRLMDLVDQWQREKDENGESIPSDYIDLIDVVIGQTRLLTTNKFKQFRGLVDKCESCETENAVRPEDLEGFWGMVFIQVENCDKRFDRLNQLKANNWEDPDLQVKKVKKIRAGGVAKPRPKPKRAMDPKLEALLQAARKKHKENVQKQANENTDQLFAFVPAPQMRTSLSNQLNNSIKPVSGTPRRSIWIVRISRFPFFVRFN